MQGRMLSLLRDMRHAIATRLGRDAATSLTGLTEEFRDTWHEQRRKEYEAWSARRHRTGNLVGK
jgi:hypothetical protein